MEAVSAVVAGLSLIIITIVSVVALINHERLRKTLNNDVKSVVTQVNDSQYNVYKFDQKQDENIKKLGSYIKKVDDHTKEIDDTIIANNKMLQTNIKNIEDNTVSKKDISLNGVPYMKTGELQLGSGYLLSENINNSDKKDGAKGWLNVLNRQGNDYAGGIAVNSIKTINGASLNGRITTTGLLDAQGMLQVAGGTSEFNPNSLMTQLPGADKKNYVRGDTILQGNASTYGDFSVGRNMNVDGRLHFKDSTYDKRDVYKNNNDSFYLEKVVGNNNSSLRLTMNNNTDSAFEVWGDNCSINSCSGGTIGHKFSGNGNQVSKGNVAALSVSTNRLCIGNTCITEAELFKIKKL